MDEPRVTILLTGPPGIGKTTILRKIAHRISDHRIGGFLTQEIREAGQRVGFRLDAFDGTSVVIAHVDFRSPHRVGRYGVDVEAIDQAVEATLSVRSDDTIYIVDEIGKMECFSNRFRSAIEGLLDAGRLRLATIALRGGGFIERVKARPDVEVWPVTERNRDDLADEVLNRLG